MKNPSGKIDLDLLSNPSQILKDLLLSLKPPKKLLVSEWADKYRMLSKKASNEAGKWRTSRAPYLKRPMDVLSENHPCKEVIVKKGAQIGFTEAGLNWLGYIMDHAPGPVLMVMPTDPTAKRNVKMRLEPMIEETPSLKEKIGVHKDKDKDNNTLFKTFPGGVLVVTGEIPPRAYAPSL